MKTFKRHIAILLVLVTFCLSPLSAYAETADSPVPKVTLVYHSGMTVSVPVKQMLAETKGTIGLLRNDSMGDDDAGCDMSIVYSAIDYAVIHGTARINVPLTDEQFRAVRKWKLDGFACVLYPGLRSFDVQMNGGDGTCQIRLGFFPYPDRTGYMTGNEYDEMIAGRICTGRDRALSIVSSVPAGCKRELKTMEYFYNYVTYYVKYHDGEYYTAANEVCLLYDALIKNDTVCAGFAYSLAYLCELAGINAQYVVVGSSDNRGSHAVVIAHVLGRDFWFDPTYDAGDGPSGFDWFGRSDAYWRQHHDCPNVYYGRELYPACEMELAQPKGYWDFSSMAYHLI